LYIVVLNRTTNWRSYVPGQRCRCDSQRDSSSHQILNGLEVPEARGNGYASRGLRDLCRLLLASTPAVVLFVRSENAPAIALYDSIGMRRVLEYRSILF